MCLYLLTSVTSNFFASSENHFCVPFVCVIHNATNKVYNVKFNVHYFFIIHSNQHLAHFFFFWKRPCSEYVRGLKSHDLPQPVHSAIVLGRQP